MSPADSLSPEQLLTTRKLLLAEGTGIFFEGFVSNRGFNTWNTQAS